jgi:ATP-binding cassette, subfamily B, bacterial MsbA
MRRRAARGEIVFRGVTLRYRDDGLPALDGLDLTVHAGQTVALVGPSGAGKSTVVNLLPRFVEPTAGTVTLDGVPLADWDTAALRRQFALVSQDVVLFNDTVAANVSLGEDLPRERVRAALASAHLLGLRRRPAAGPGHADRPQRQRALGRPAPAAGDRARAVQGRAGPDPRRGHVGAGQRVRARRAGGAGTLMAGRTTLVIAHRLSTIEHADRVVAMDAGRVVEQGTHAELLAAGGLYARLHAMQFRS